MKKFSALFMLALFAVPTVSFAKDMAGTMVKCVTKRVTNKETGDSIIIDSSKPNYKLYSMPHYIAVTKDQKFICDMLEEARCSDKKYIQFSYEPIPNNETGAHITDDYYYVEVSNSVSTKVSRDGSMFYIENREEKRHGYCEFVRNIEF